MIGTDNAESFPSSRNVRNVTGEDDYQGWKATGSSTVLSTERGITVDAVVVHPDGPRLGDLLARTGVAVASGIDFDTADGRRYLRFSFAGTAADIDAALDRLDGAL